MDNQDFHTFRGYEMMKRNQAGLTPSMEDYLEMIYRNCLTEGYIRINQLAEQLNVKASSASKVVRKLADSGYLAYEKYGIIQLTPQGTITGEFLLDRHKTVEKFLHYLGTQDNALLETELIEHYLSLETLSNIKTFNAFLDTHSEILSAFNDFRKGRIAPAADDVN